jgi:hypothetical protein
LEILPETLPSLSELERIVSRLAELGVLDRARDLKEAIQHKQRQIMENLYNEHPPLPENVTGSRKLLHFEDFVGSGESRKYDLFVDAYNILLMVTGKGKNSTAKFLPAMREDFLATLSRKSRHFHKVYAVFDGQEDSRDRLGNMEIIYTDKGRGATADAFIIDTIKKRKDQSALLVTGDQEVIRHVEGRIFGLIQPLHFYMFVHDLIVPPLPAS